MIFYTLYHFNIMQFLQQQQRQLPLSSQQTGSCCGRLVALSHPIKSSRKCCLLLKLLPKSAAPLINYGQLSHPDHCFCRTETVIVMCDQTNEACRRLVEFHSSLTVGDWLEFSSISRPVKLALDSVEFGCWRCDLNENFDLLNDTKIVKSRLTQGVKVSTNSGVHKCSCIVSQCSSYQEWIDIRIVSLSLCSSAGFARVNILAANGTGFERLQLGSEEPALLAYFPSTMTALSPRTVGCTIRLCNAHVYTGVACQPIRLATNNSIATVIVAFVYTSFHCPELGNLTFINTTNSSGNVEVKENRSINQNWRVCRQSGENDSSAVLRLLSWSLTLENVKSSSSRSLLPALCSALSLATKESVVEPPQHRSHQQLVVDFIKTRQPDINGGGENINRRCALSNTLAMSLSDLATISNEPGILIGQRLAFDCNGERMRLDLFKSSAQQTDSNSTCVGIRLIYDGLFNLSLSTSLTSIVALKLTPTFRQLRQIIIKDWDGVECLLTRLSYLVTSHHKLRPNIRASVSMQRSTVSFELTVTTCHSVDFGLFSLAGRINPSVTNSNGHSVLIEMEGSAGILRELLLPSGTYRIVTDENSMSNLLQSTNATDESNNQSPALIRLRRRPISVECVRLRQSDWLTPSRARSSGHLRLFSLRGRLLDFGCSCHGNSDQSYDCQGNAWLLIGDPLAEEEIARVEFSTPINRLRRFKLLSRLAQSDLWIEDVLLLNVSRRQIADADARRLELDCICTDGNPTMHLLSVTRSANGRPPLPTSRALMSEPHPEWDSIGGLIEFSLPPSPPSSMMAAVEPEVRCLTNWCDEGRVFQLDCFMSAVCRLQFQPSTASAVPNQRMNRGHSRMPLAEAFVLLQDGTQTAGLSCRGFINICRLLAFPQRFADSLSSINHLLTYRRCWDDGNGGGGGNATGDGSYLTEVLRYYLESSICRRPLSLLVRLRRQPLLMTQLTPNDLLPRRRLPDVSLTLMKVL